MTKIAVLGAAGKMGTRISRSLADEPQYEVLCVEGNAEGEQKLQARGDRAWAMKGAVPQADIVIMASPDRIFGTIAAPNCAPHADRSHAGLPGPCRAPRGIGAGA